MAAEKYTIPELLDIMRQQPKNEELALFLGARLAEAGKREQAVALWSLGDDHGGFVRNIRNDVRAPKQMQEDSNLANTELCNFLTELHDKAIDNFETRTGEKVDRMRAGIWCLTNVGDFEFANPLQRPVIFYVPDLSSQAVWPHERLENLRPLVDGFSNICEEYSAAASDFDGIEPYVPANTSGKEWLKLRGKLDWSALYLFKNSQPTGNAALFPKTLKLFEELDTVRVNGNPMEIFFSRLTPGAHIPPHFGLTNSRLTVHLPIIVPDDCGIKIANENHEWHRGRILGFDDSFEHEAWNRSEMDRVVLIFEIHHPALSQAERKAIEHCYAARNEWLDNRRKLLGWN